MMLPLLSPLLRLSLAFVFLFASLPLACSLHLSGEVLSSSTFVYLAKFAFVDSGGNFTATTASRAQQSASSSPLLLLYPDIDGLWSSASDSSTSCVEKVALALSRQDAVPIGEYVNVGVEGRRPHWWYFAVSDCNASSLAVSYDLTFSNGGGAWVRPVSYNEQHIAETSLTFFIVYLLLLAVAAAAVRKASTAAVSTPRPQLLLLTATVCLALLSCLLTFAEYATLINTNTQHVKLSSAAYFFLHAAHCLLLLSILLTCYGFPTLTRRLRPLPALLVSALTAAFFGLYIAAFCVQQAQPAWSTTFVFNNGAGYALALLYGVVLLPLCLLLLYRIGGQQRLYAAYVFFYFLSFPFIILGASLADSWWVAKAEYAATGCVLIIALSAQLAFYQPFYNRETAGKQSFSTLNEESVRKHSSNAADTGGAVGGDGGVELSVSEAHVITADNDGAVVPV